MLPSTVLSKASPSAGVPVCFFLGGVLNAALSAGNHCMHKCTHVALNFLGIIFAFQLHPVQVQQQKTTTGKGNEKGCVLACAGGGGGCLEREKKERGKKKKRDIYLPKE